MQIDTCYICKSESDNCERCDDCGEECCDLCRADFPHHDPPHVRCENCYFQRGNRSKGRDYA